MIEPDQHAQPIVGEKPGEDFEAPGAEGVGRQAEAHGGGDAGADRAILIVPGRIARGLQERVDDRGHPQAPAQHLNGVFDEAGDAFAADHAAHRRHVALQQRRQEEQIEREQRRGEHPLNHARQRFVVEQLDAAGQQTEIGCAPFREQRVDDVRRDRLAGDGVVDRDVIEEFLRHRGELAGVEIPADGAAEQRAEKGAERVDAPALQALARPARDRDCVQHQIDAGIDKRAEGAAGKEAPEVALGAEALRHQPGDAEPDDEAARVISRIAILRDKAMAKGRRGVGAFQHGAAEREQKGARERREGVAERGHQFRRALPADDDGERMQNGDEDAAIDEAFRRTGFPDAAHIGGGRRPAPQHVGKQRRNEINLSPEPSLRQRRRADDGRRAPDQRRIGDELIRTHFGDVRRQRREKSGENQHDMQPDGARHAPPHGRCDAGDDRLVDDDEHQRAAERALHFRLQELADQRPAAQLIGGAGAQRQQHVEDERQHAQRDAGLPAQVLALHGDADRAGYDVEPDRENGAGGAQTEHVDPCARRAPQHAAGIDDAGQSKDGDEINRMLQRRGETSAQGETPDRQRSRAAQSRERRRLPAAVARRENGRKSKREPDEPHGHPSENGRDGRGGHGVNIHLPGSNGEHS